MVQAKGIVIDKSLNEPTRRCDNPRCRHLLTRRDELKGRCPMCLQILVSLRSATEKREQ
jgi:hypothetical protein